ncbi:MAG: hypothetical protein IH867_03510 [Chloroflexi bacterium]|nr:hypothetical protein [Chloroflexota bacterium]
MTPLERLKESLRAADSLRRIEFQISDVDPPIEKLKPPVAAVRAGVLVLAVSAFEKFIVDVAQTQAARIRNRVPARRFDRLPDTIQKISVIEGLRSAISTKGKWVSDRLPAISLASADVVSKKVRTSAFGNTRESGVKAVNEILKPFGIENVLNDPVLVSDFESRWGQPEIHSFLQDRLNEIVRRRHLQAHAFGMVSGLAISRVVLPRDVVFLGIVSSLIASRLRARTSDIINSAIGAAFPTTV